MFFSYKYINIFCIYIYRLMHWPNFKGCDYYTIQSILLFTNPIIQNMCLVSLHKAFLLVAVYMGTCSVSHSLLESSLAISKDCSNTFLERSFIYAAPCEWNKLSEHIRTSNFDCFRKSVKTMLFTQQYGC